MSRYIDADEFLEDNKEFADREIEHPRYQETVRELIDEAPSIDIVFCKECKYYYDGHWCSEWEYLKKNPDDFCSYGELAKDINVRSKGEPQTETEVAKAIVHKMIDDAVIAEDAYPDLRQKMHDAVDEYEPQTENPCKTCETYWNCQGQCDEIPQIEDEWSEERSE